MENSPANIPRQRTSFTDIERQGLREHRMKYPTTSHPALASWFELQFGRKISVSSVHDILSPKYAYLDGVKATAATRKQRGPQWRDLENALFDWWQQQQSRRPTGKELKDKAQELWKLVPAFDGKSLPSFSDGWLTNWRNRNGITPSSTWSTAVTFSGSQSLMFEHTKHRKRQRSEKYGTALKSHSPTLRSPSKQPFPGELLNGSVRHHTTCHSVHQDLWARIINLSHEFSAQSFQDRIIPAERVFSIFEPIFTAAEEGSNLSYQNAMNTGRQNSRCGGLWPRPIPKEIQDAFGLFKLAGAFRLPRYADDTQSTSLEEWFLDYMSPEALRVQSLEFAQQNSFTSMVLAQDAVEVVSGPKSHQLRSHKTFTLPLGNGGRCTAWTRTCTTRMGPNGSDILVHFCANIIINPPKGMDLVPNTVFRLSSETRHYKSTLLTPIISFRRMRPNTDKIFQIAKYGTSDALQMALSTGEASLTDCDSEGRSLINYALRGKNPSTLKYLLVQTDDIDAHELDSLRILRPLAGLLPLIPRSSFSQLRRQSCMSLLLDYGADLSLPYDPETTSRSSIFFLEAALSPESTVKLMLDKGGLFSSHSSTQGLEIDFLNLMKPFSIYSGDFSVRTIRSHKVNLLLERGADVMTHDQFGRNCLHLLFTFSQSPVEIYPHSALKDTLMPLVTAGADIDACDNSGESVAEAVFKSNQEELWIEVLAECGYNPKPLFQSLDHYYRGINYSFGVFAIAAPKMRLTRLSFAEYGKQREYLLRGNEDAFIFSDTALKQLREWANFVKFLEEEDVDEDDEDDQNNWESELDTYCTEHGADWWI